MNVLSLFDGMSCGQIALERAGINVRKYYASELDKYAITVTQANYPDTIQLGDVTKWREWDIDWAGIDLLIGGSPCQGFSFAGKQLAFDDPRSKLFFVYVDILNHIKKHNPNVKFLLENVRMKKEFLDVISEQLGVQPVFINSALVSAQNRQRYYWANWEFGQPEDKGIVLADILEETNNELRPCERIKEGNEGHIANATDIKGMDCIKRVYGQDGKAPTLTTMGGGHREPKVLINESRRQLVFDKPVRSGIINKGGQGDRIYSRYGKAISIGAQSGGSAGNGNLLVGSPKSYRKLTPIECERLQTVSDNYSAHVSNTQRYKMLGNGFTVDVISHILSCNDWAAKRRIESSNENKTIV